METRRQYTRSRVQAWFGLARGLQASMGSEDDCYDNAWMERVHALLKRECLFAEPYLAQRQAHTHLFGYLEVFYQQQRWCPYLDHQPQ